MSKITWKHVKHLSDERSVEVFLAKNSIELPLGIVECIKENNGGRPILKIFDTDRTKERVFKSLLSYNRGDKESIYNSYSNELRVMGLFPIALDAAGNFICVNLKSNNELVLLEHESGNIEQIGPTFEDLIRGLY